MWRSERKRIGEEGTTFFFSSSFLLARKPIYILQLRSIARLGDIREGKRVLRRCWERIEEEGRKGGREGTYNVATSSRRLDAGFGTVQQVDEQVSRFPSFEFAFPSLSRRVVAARFSLTNFLRDTIPFHYHSSQTIISSLCNDQIIFYNFIFFLNSPFHDIFIKTYEYVKNNFISKSYNEIISRNTFLNPNPLL